MNTTPTPPKTGIFLTLGFVFAAIYAIMSIFAMNDLWKCYVDQRFGDDFGFGDPMMFCNSGGTYLYSCLIALALSLAMFFIRIRKGNSKTWLIHAVIAAVLIIAGAIFWLSSYPDELMFMDYVASRFYPFWAFTLASFFVIRCIAVLTRSTSK
ncbi:MAG: hypothetical protein ACJ77K_05550 [Bacteroidia bacterium]